MLFVGEHAVWPLDQGFCVHGYNTAKAMSNLGLNVGLASITEPPADIPTPLRQMNIPWPKVNIQNTEDFMAAWSGPGAYMRKRLADYQGRDLPRFGGIVELVEQYQPKTVIGLGQHSVMMLKGLSQFKHIRKVWYAADELVRFQLSCMKQEGVRTLSSRLQKLALYAGLENLFARGLDGAIGVAPTETKLLKLIAGVKETVTIRNGVDLDYFQPQKSPRLRQKIVFWGRMDFEPNIDAVRWFCKHVWPTLRKRHPRARFQIVGKNPLDSVLALDQLPGVEVTGAVADVRPYVHSAGMTVLPMRCGGGIKNKLLEAAAMGIPMVCSPKAIEGLIAPPAMVCRQKNSWVQAIERLWAEPLASQYLRTQGRQWAQEHHSWQAAATNFVHWLDQLPAEDSQICRHSSSPPTEYQIPKAA